jgi:hypothetical protein
MSDEIDKEYINNLDKIRKCTDNHILYTDSEELEEMVSHTYKYKGNYKDYKHFTRRTSIKKNDNEKIRDMTLWCKDCNTVYKAVCNSGIDQIISLYNIDINKYKGNIDEIIKNNFLDDIDEKEKNTLKIYNAISHKCKEYDKTYNIKEMKEQDIKKLKQQIEEIGAYKGIIHKCSRYRENQHKNCYYNVSDDKYQGDLPHQHFLKQIKSNLKSCENTGKHLLAYINEYEQKNKQENKQVKNVVRSLDSKGAKYYSKKIRSKYSKDKEHHKYG